MPYLRTAENKGLKIGKKTYAAGLINWLIKMRKPQYIMDTLASRRLPISNKNYVILRRFSAKEDDRRLTAVPLLTDYLSAKHIGLENHLNYIYRPGGAMSKDLAVGLAALYNSSLLDGYFRCSSGNTQISAAELRMLPLPSLDAIAKLGQRIKPDSGNLELINQLVNALTISGELN